MDDELKLYAMAVDQLTKYSAIFWQAPALVGGNVFALEKLEGRPWAVLALAVFNAAMIFAFSRMVTRQQSIIDATRSAEAALRERFPAFVPNFRPPAMRGLRSPRYLVWTMGVLDVALGAYGISMLIGRCHG